MNNNDLKTLVTSPENMLLTHEVSLYQRNLSGESSNWLRQVESTAKSKKKGKVVLIAVLVDA